jgi:hypothetical protein
LKIKREIKVTGKRERRRKQLLNDLEESTGYLELKEETLDRTVRRTGFTWGADKSLARPGRKHILFIIIIGGILLLFIYITRLASNEIFSPSHKIHREVGRAKDLSAPRYKRLRICREADYGLTRVIRYYTTG